jgi:hypothetical protein
MNEKLEKFLKETNLDMCTPDFKYEDTLAMCSKNGCELVEEALENDRDTTIYGWEIKGSNDLEDFLINYEEKSPWERLRKLI